MHMQVLGVELLDGGLVGQVQHPARGGGQVGPSLGQPIGVGLPPLRE